METSDSQTLDAHRGAAAARAPGHAAERAFAVLRERRRNGED